MYSNPYKKHIKIYKKSIEILKYNTIFKIKYLPSLVNAKE